MKLTPLQVDKIILTILTILFILLCMLAGYYIGHYKGFVDAVRIDYQSCATNLRDRDEANGDLKPTDPVQFYEYCAKHADNIYGDRSWKK